MPSHIVIADDHPLFREALKLAVSSTLVDTHITEADSAASLFAALDEHDDVANVYADFDISEEDLAKLSAG